jgi:rubrerythrin
MGYNLFSVKRLKEGTKKKLDSFAQTLGPAIARGEQISFADQDITNYIRLQHERIEEKGLTMEYEVYDRDKQEDPIVSDQWRDGHYDSYNCFEEYGVKRMVARSGKKLYKDNKPHLLHTTFADFSSGVHPDNEPFTCPSCGSVSTIAELQNGCPYCQTRFKMDDLLPKVTKYYFTEEPGGNWEEIKPRLVAIAIVLDLIYLLIDFIRRFDYYSEMMSESMIEFVLCAIITAGLGFVFAFFMAYIFLGPITLVRAIMISRQYKGRSMVIRTRKKFEELMKPICPEYSYDYFTGKITSMVEQVIFAKDAQDMVFYKGTGIDASFRNIIDMNYGASWNLMDFQVGQGTVTVTTDVLFFVLRAEGDTVKNVPERYRAVFRRRTDVPMSTSFSISKIECPSCGGSFNAWKSKKCPFCGTDYDAETQDWVLLELERM